MDQLFAMVDLHNSSLLPITPEIFIFMPVEN
jgi:hypothetical protein